MTRHTAAYENQRAEGPKAGDLAKPSTAATNQPTPPAINNSSTTSTKKSGFVARSCGCNSTTTSGNISVYSLLFIQKKRAPSAHASRFGLCTNGVQYSVGLAGASYPAA